MTQLVNGKPAASEALKTAVRAADAKGATNPVALQVGDRFSLADEFLIVTGSVERNVQAISDEIEDELNAAGVRTIRREGRSGGRWVLLDFGDLIAHVFHQDEREFYGLERLWKDCPVLAIDEVLAEAADLRGDETGGVE